MLKFALVVSMLFQLGAAVFAISLIRRTRYNISWILISVGFVLMALRRLFDFSSLFWKTRLFQQDEINNWIAVLISLFMFIGVVFIRKIFNLQDHIERLRQESEQKVLSAIISTEEREREKFARELHDGLGPVLSSIRMSLSAIKMDAISPANREILQSAYNASDSSVTILKEIANSLSPHILKNYGLGKAIEVVAEQLLPVRNIRFEPRLDFNEDCLSEEMKFGCFRIISELINNSIKHASPTVITLEIGEWDQILTMKYKDNGRGHEYLQSENSKQSGMGYNNILSRMKSLNGKCYVKTSLGEGFSVLFYFPLNSLHPVSRENKFITGEKAP